MTQEARFLFATCQVGAEAAMKRQLARRWPDIRPAFSRPGLVTFKVPGDRQLTDEFVLETVFARAWGFSLGKIEAADAEAMARQAWALAPTPPPHWVHVWQRETAPPAGESPPEDDSPMREARAAMLRNCPSPTWLDTRASDALQPARLGDRVLDCVLVEPGQWWIGYHRVSDVPSQWPGGEIPLTLPPEAVSRAWLKMEEALRWSQLPIRAGAQFAEIGSAPGGASQALLSRGFRVLGIDPAEMHPDVLAHPNFTHLRKRASEVRRREFRKVRWLSADMNVAPSYTLDAVEDIVTHPQVNIRGMLLTLKLFHWTLADHLPEYLERVRQWGYNMVRARQLWHNRREICVAALQKPFVKKANPRL